MVFGLGKLLVGVALMAAAFHLVEVRRHGPLPPVYNIGFLAVGMLGFFVGVFTSFADLKSALQWLRAARRSADDLGPHAFSHTLDDEHRLHALTPADADAFFDLITHNHDFLADWLTPETLVESRADAVDRLYELDEARRAGLVVPVGIRKAGELVGVVGLGPIDAKRRSAQIYYWIDQTSQGRGLVTRSCSALLDYAFEELRLRRVVIRCEPRNTRSCAVAERLGFELEGTLRQCERKGEELIDLRIYAMLRGEGRESHDA
jgi:ribosomal-protein-serine acetyltransferase